VHFEYEDYRKLPPKPYMGSWPLWTPPKGVEFDYFAKILFILFVLPWLFGVAFTVLGFFTNFLLVDWILYHSYKRKINEIYGDDG